MQPSRNVAEVFVEFADTLIADFDLLAFLDLVCVRSVELFPIEASGILVRDHRGDLQVVAASSEETRLLELFQIQNRQGPCLDAISLGAPAYGNDPAQLAAHWPLFAERIRGQFSSVYALPMRLRSELVGCLNLFGATPGALQSQDLGVAQALADTATIGILQQRMIRESAVLSEQLQGALNSRITIEQAKGVYAERNGTDMASAFGALRDYARAHNLAMSDVASGYIGGSIQLGRS